MCRLTFLSFLLVLSFFSLKSQNKSKSALIAFYNLENFYDTINDPKTKDDEFTPEAENHWNTEKYNIKLEHISKVIKEIGDENGFKCPTVMGMCEIENKQVIQDLINSQNLKIFNYGFEHYDCRYERGVDVALIYRKDRFIVVNSKAYPLIIPDKPDFNTRDQLLVSGILDGEVVHFIVNHWPSRRGGEKRSAPMREAAAKLCRHIVDSIYKTDSTAKIIIMGDLNDDPTNASIIKHIGAQKTKESTKNYGLYNPMYELFKKKGIGSLAYNDKWNLFDQFIVSYPLISKSIGGYKFIKAGVFNKPYLMQKEGQFAGYPFRTYVGTTFMGGYSDHFPSFIIISK